MYAFRGHCGPLAPLSQSHVTSGTVPPTSALYAAILARFLIEGSFEMHSVILMHGVESLTICSNCRANNRSRHRCFFLRKCAFVRYCLPVLRSGILLQPIYNLWPLLWRTKAHNNARVLGNS